MLKTFSSAFLLNSLSHTRFVTVVSSHRFRRVYFPRLALLPQLWQLCYRGSKMPCLITRKHGRSAPALIFEINVAKCLSITISHNKVVVLFCNGPGSRKAVTG